MPDFKRLGELRAKRPLIHCISNIVTANDCANVALAVGASPIMAQAVEEMADISRASDAVVLNTGTPDEAKFGAALACARISGAEGRPVVIDPVGVGASPWRLRRVRGLLEIPARGIVRVNLAEARALLSLSGREQGVDSPERASEDERAATARALAAALGRSVLLTGPQDIAAGPDGTAYAMPGGSALMAYVTGTGCMLSVLCGAFAAVEPDMTAAAALASAFWKLCAARAEENAAGRGPGSFRAALLDAAWAITVEEFHTACGGICLRPVLR